MLTPLKLPPGIVKNGTAYQARGRWRDCNFIRWVEGIIQPVGGWRRISDTPLTGRVSGMFSLRDFVNRDHLAIGTSSKCYVLQGSTYADVTPVDLEAGLEAASPGLGYGSLDYGEEEYGTERTGPVGIILESQHWSFDVWGQFLVACSLGDGRLWVWDPGDLSTPADTTLQLMDASAPIDCRGVLVTDERHVMAWGADGDPRLIRWSDREDYTTWAPTATNRAGDLLLQTQGVIRRVIKVGGAYLALTSNDAFLVSYVGVPSYYGSEKVGVNCGVVGPRAMTATNDFVVWMGNDGFYLYNGQVQPLQCDVWDWVYRIRNELQDSQVTCGQNSDFFEIWWFFSVNEDTTNSRYVVWNYKQNIWYTGTLGRAHWNERGVWPRMTAAGNDNHIYEHEIALGTPGLAARSKPFIESAPVDIANGDQVVYVTQLIPDKDALKPDSLEFRFYARPNPKVAATEYGPFVPDSDGYTDVRFGARQIQMRITAVTDVDWRIGVMRADFIPGGRR